jgi:hypothetical protein
MRQRQRQRWISSPERCAGVLGDERVHVQLAEHDVPDEL